MSKERQKHIENRIAQVLDAGVHTPEYDRIHAEQSAEMMKRNARLSEIIQRLPPDRRKAVMLVLLQETSMLLFTFILEGAFLLHNPAMKRAAACGDHAAFEDAERHLNLMMNV